MTKLEKETQAVVDRLAELEVIKKQVIKPFYDEQAQLMKKLDVGRVYQGSNGICLMIEECEGQYIYNKTHGVKRTKVSEDDTNTLAAKTAKEAGFEPEIPTDTYGVRTITTLGIR